MGREIKRVPLDFAWPQDKIWYGYLNPFYVHSSKCQHCGGTGTSPVARHLADQWYGNAPFKPEDRGSKPFTSDHPAIRSFAERNVGNSPSFYGSGEQAIQCEAQRLADHFNRSWSHHLNADDVAALLEGERLHDLTCTFVKGTGWKKKDPAYVPSPEEVNVWSLRSFGHDSINQWTVVAAECERLGIDRECEHCSGKGSNWNPPEAEKQADEWERIEPPSGVGFQLWETVSEGSPISPVFASAEELANWLVAGIGYKWRMNDEGTTFDQWMKFITVDEWCPTLIANENGVRSGVIG